MICESSWEISVSGPFTHQTDLPYLESSSNHRLRSYDCRQDSNDQTGVQHSWWHTVEERIRPCGGIDADIGCLSNIGE